MTKTSIDTILADHENAQTLKRFVPLMDEDESEIRELLMSPGLYQWCYQSDSKKTRYYKANIRAFLKLYVVGMPVDNEDYFKSWRDDVFEIRVQLQPYRENTRIFGAFIKPDCFVGIHQRLRSDCGPKGDPRWDRAIDRVTHEWIGLFPGYPRTRSYPFANCITSNCVDVNL